MRPADLERLGLAGLEQLGLVEAREDNGALLDAALGVRGAVVGLDHVLASHVAGIGHVDGHSDRGAVIREVGDLLVKGGVREAIAKRVLDRGVVVYEAIGRRGLIVAVAHVDALGVVHKVDVLGAGGRVSRACEHGLVGVLDVGVVVRAKVVVARCALHGVREGVDGATAGVHGTGEHLANGLAAGGAGRPHPQCGVNRRIVNKAQLHGVGTVEHHDHAVEVGLDHGEEVLLVGREFQVAAARLGALVARHVRGQVEALAALAGENHDGRVGVRLGVVDDVLRVAGLRQLVEVPVRTHESHVLGRGGILLVELLEIGVHREACVFKPLVERHVLAGVTRAGTRSAVAEVVADRGAKDVHLGHARERKRVALVLEQRDSLGLDLLGNVARGLACPLDLRRLHVWPGGERGHQVKVRRDHNPHGKRHRNH